MLPVIRYGVRSLEPTHWFNRDFDRLLTGCCDDTDRTVTGVYPVDIREDDDNFTVEAEMPGFTKDQISVSIEKGVLSISAERNTVPDATAKAAGEPSGDKSTSHLTERRYNRVHRSFTLPTSVDESKSQARLDQGVLHLTLPKIAEVKPRKITIT